MARESMVFYASFLEAGKELNKEDRRDFIEVVLDYGIYGKEPEMKKGVVKALFTLVKPSIDANNQRYEASKKGGAPKGNQNARRVKVPDVFEVEE